ncbi:MAG: hypothetical protein V8S92_02115 [Oscillospiraceae bacterium]
MPTGRRIRMSTPIPTTTSMNTPTAATSTPAPAAPAAQTPKQELMALMKYMVGHNTAHANELAQLAKQLQDLGENAAYEQIMLAVSDFEKGNLRLSTVLTSMNG